MRPSSVLATLVSVISCASEEQSTRRRDPRDNPASARSPGPARKLGMGFRRLHAPAFHARTRLRADEQPLHPRGRTYSRSDSPRSSATERTVRRDANLGSEKVALVYLWSDAFRTAPPSLHRRDQL